jgi:hypothetical protein
MRDLIEICTDTLDANGWAPWSTSPTPGAIPMGSLPLVRPPSQILRSGMGRQGRWKGASSPCFPSLGTPIPESELEIERLLDVVLHSSKHCIYVSLKLEKLGVEHGLS